jgi:hypothetical protein
LKNKTRKTHKTTVKLKNRQKPSPRIVYRFGKQDEEIQEYLQFRRKIKGIIKTMDAEQKIHGKQYLTKPTIQ